MYSGNSSSNKIRLPPIEGKNKNLFIKVGTILFIVILILILGGMWYDTSSHQAILERDRHSFLWYDLLIDINTFALIGFGFTMTYLRKYGFSSLSYTLLVASFGIPFGIWSSDIVDYFFVGTGIGGLFCFIVLSFQDIITHILLPNRR